MFKAAASNRKKPKIGVPKLDKKQGFLVKIIAFFKK
jgi:hypothetical protein